ncbi:MAG: hypothetical protein A2X57_07920 [Nitrospirae bacterium GWD2_57_8]|nr:MAG: hypothetical protein A2X57_07920 [Nitrospirae bacterium GWD2_57_8]
MKSDKKLCLNFCKYYKPEKNEELECRGAVIVRRLMQNGRRVPLDRPAEMTGPSAIVVEKLKSSMCSDCDFLAEDCDFILTGGQAVPCGGFVLLAHLLDKGTIEIEDLVDELKRDSPL